MCLQEYVCGCVCISVEGQKFTSNDFLNSLLTLFFETEFVTELRAYGLVWDV